MAASFNSDRQQWRHWRLEILRESHERLLELRYLLKPCGFHRATSYGVEMALKWSLVRLI